MKDVLKCVTKIYTSGIRIQTPFITIFLCAKNCHRIEKEYAVSAPPVMPPGLAAVDAIIEMQVHEGATLSVSVRR